MIKGYVSLHVPNLSGFPLSRIDSHTDLTERGKVEEGRGRGRGKREKWHTDLTDLTEMGMREEVGLNLMKQVL